MASLKLIILTGFLFLSVAAGANRCPELLTSSLRFTKSEDPKISEFVQSLRERHKDSKFYVKEPFREQINSNSYEVLAFLGKGVEGVVYLARNSDNQLVTLKYFNNLDEARTHVTSMKFLKENGVRSLKIFDTRFDIFPPAVVQEYVEGVELYNLNSQAKKIGIPLEVHQDLIDKASEIRSKFSKLRDGAQFGSPGFDLEYYPFNVLYDFSSGELVVIDGR